MYFQIDYSKIPYFPLPAALSLDDHHDNDDDAT
jgi:hypothetical protein